jgi:hypothetical protein
MKIVWIMGSIVRAGLGQGDSSLGTTSGGECSSTEQGLYYFGGLGLAAAKLAAANESLCDSFENQTTPYSEIQEATPGVFDEQSLIEL